VCLIEKSEVLLITVPDSEISPVAYEISKIAYESGRGFKGKVFLHTSGAATSEEMAPIKDKGGFTGSLHPAQTFPDRENSWKSMFNIYFGYEGSEEAKKYASDIVKSLNGKMLMLTAESKPLYHAAACVISNYTVTLSHVAGTLLEAAGIEREIGMKAFAPLLNATVANIIDSGSVNALTGPVSRGDAETVLDHLNAMEAKLYNKESTIELYKLLGKETIKLALEKGTIDDEKAEELMMTFGSRNNRQGSVKNNDR